MCMYVYASGLKMHMKRDTAPHALCYVTGNSTDSPGLWPRSLGCSAQCTFGTASSRSQSVPLLAAPFPELHTWTIRREGKKGVKELGIC